MAVRRNNRNHPRGKTGLRRDLGVIFRSRWEANYARILNLFGAPWIYEYKKFKTPYGSYTPDFYLPEQNVYVEVKGREFNGKQAIKRAWLAERCTLHMVDSKAYKDLQTIYRKYIPLWES